MSIATSTIAAIATAAGPAGVGIIRLSGPQAAPIAEALCRAVVPVGQISYRCFFDQAETVIDDGVVLRFQAPRSFTGEDVVELQAHGSPVLLSVLLQRCYELGAEPAKPGEFTQRAFLNDKLDLAQAEAVADLISAGTEQAARSARRSLEGRFSRLVDQLLSTLIELRVFVESALDFPDEEIEFLQQAQIAQRTEVVCGQLRELLAQAKQGVLLTQGAEVVIVGAPNVGKSTLLNALANKNLAIVTDIAGTTRDLISVDLQIDGVPLRLTDTAGLRDASDVIEQEGIRRAQAALEKADMLLIVYDVSRPETQQLPSWVGDARQRPHLVIHNKVDLSTDLSTDLSPVWPDSADLRLSLHTDHGVEQLKAAIKATLGIQTQPELAFSARGRHVQALSRVLAHTEQALALQSVGQSSELVAEELRLAQLALAEVTGQFSADELLGEIFSSFCIGK